ncbi:MAG: FAD-dependent oxidoreductase [Gammaproteobacteria bacterium]|nr:FAD-dependent oxidoreductase [Gammaproteobacteria bacterium]
MPSNNAPDTIAIVGTGMAGLTCATSLQLTCPNVTLFEQAFHPGGRMSTYRKKGHEFDDGLQYFTAIDERFQYTLEPWLEEGVVAEWEGWCVDLDAGNFLRRDDHAKRYVAVPRMNALMTYLAGLCEIEYGCRISSIKPTEQGNVLYDQFGRELGTFDRVVLAMPPSASMPLIEDIETPVKQELEQVSMTAVWTLLMSFDQPTGLFFDSAFVAKSPLDWISRNNSKPGRTGRESWVAVATPEWTEQYQKYSESEIRELLYQAFVDAVGGLQDKPDFMDMEFWPDAKTIQVAGKDYLYDAELGIGLCGDWCLGTRLESAFLSGLAMANQLIEET